MRRFCVSYDVSVSRDRSSAFAGGLESPESTPLCQVFDYPRCLVLGSRFFGRWGVGTP